MRENYDDPMGRKFREKLNDYEPEFDPSHWVAMQKRLQDEGLNSPAISSHLWQKYRYSALLALFLMASGAIWVLNSDKGQNIDLKDLHANKKAVLSEHQKMKHQITPKIQPVGGGSVSKTKTLAVDSEKFPSENNQIRSQDLEKSVVHHTTEVIDNQIDNSKIYSNHAVILGQAPEKLAQVSTLGELPLILPYLEGSPLVLSEISLPKSEVSFESKSEKKFKKLHWGITISGGSLNMPSKFRSHLFYGGGLTAQYDLHHKFRLRTGFSVNHLHFDKILPQPKPDNVVYALDPTNNMLLIKRFVERNAYAHTAYANWFLAEIPLEIDYQMTEKFSISVGFVNQMIMQEYYTYEYEVAPLDGLPETHKDVNLTGKIYPVSGSRLGIHVKPRKNLPLEISSFVNISTQKLGKEQAQMNRFGINMTYYFR